MTYLLITILLIALELIYFKVADKFNIIDKPNLRSSHTSVTLRGGGIIFLLGMWVYAAFNGLQYPWFLLGLTAISGISFCDDIKPVSNKIRLVVQFAAMFLLFYQFGILSLQFWWIVLIALVFSVGIINAYNFMDGINGITGGYSLAVLLPLLYLNTDIQFLDTNLLIVATISVVVFNIFNFRKRAKCFAGDVGAVSIAFILIFALGSLILKTQDVSYILLLGVYGVDTVLTIVHRIMLKENLGEAHRKHAYQLMANELEMSHVAVACVYMVLQLVISFGLILLPLNHYIYAIVVIIALSVGYVSFKKKYYYLHEVYLNSKK